MTTDLALLATEALADAERGTPGPWRWGDWRTSWGLLESEFRMTLEFNPTYLGEQAPIVRERDTNEAVRVLTVESEIGEADRAFIAAARTREPLLAAGVLQLLEEQRKLTLLWKALGDNTSEVEDLTRDRDEYKQQHDNALASWATDRKNLEDAAHRSRCDLLDEQAKCAELTRQLAEANRELERWRHGVTIEGDFVCPDSLALSEARAELRAVGKVTP